MYIHSMEIGEKTHKCISAEFIMTAVGCLHKVNKHTTIVNEINMTSFQKHLLQGAFSAFQVHQLNSSLEFT